MKAEEAFIALRKQISPTSECRAFAARAVIYELQRIARVAFIVEETNEEGAEGIVISPGGVAARVGVRARDGVIEIWHGSSAGTWEATPLDYHPAYSRFSWQDGPAVDGLAWLVCQSLITQLHYERHPRFE